jgi:hypothetical protein
MNGRITLLLQRFHFEESKSQSDVCESHLMYIHIAWPTHPASGSARMDMLSCHATLHYATWLQAAQARIPAGKPRKAYGCIC